MDGTQKDVEVNKNSLCCTQRVFCASCLHALAGLSLGRVTGFYRSASSCSCSWRVGRTWGSWSHGGNCFPWEVLRVGPSDFIGCLRLRTAQGIEPSQSTDADSGSAVETVLCVWTVHSSTDRDVHRVALESTNQTSTARGIHPSVQLLYLFQLSCCILSWSRGALWPKLKVPFLSFLVILFGVLSFLLPFCPVTLNSLWCDSLFALLPLLFILTSVIFYFKVRPCVLFSFSPNLLYPVPYCLSFSLSFILSSFVLSLFLLFFILPYIFLLTFFLAFYLYLFLSFILHAFFHPLFFLPFFLSSFIISFSLSFFFSSFVLSFSSFFLPLFFLSSFLSLPSLPHSTDDSQRNRSWNSI